MVYNMTLNDHENVGSSCTIYIELLSIISIIPMGIGSVYISIYGYTIKKVF